jgi:hypothetical protein
MWRLGFGAVACPFAFAHRAFWTRLILFRAAADMVRSAGATLSVFASDSDCDSLFKFTHLVRCASAIL